MHCIFLILYHYIIYIYINIKIFLLKIEKWLTYSSVFRIVIAFDWCESQNIVTNIPPSIPVNKPKWKCESQKWVTHILLCIPHCYCFWLMWVAFFNLRFRVCTYAKYSINGSLVNYIFMYAGIIAIVRGYYLPFIVFKYFFLFFLLNFYPFFRFPKISKLLFYRFQIFQIFLFL